MNLTIHRGAKEIGGNCVEINSGNTRILFDYGTPLSNPSVSRPRRRDNSEHILNIEGLYADSKSPLNGIIISHTHLDHYGMIFEKPVRPPLYMSEIMEDIVKITGIFALGGKNLDWADIKHFRKGMRFDIGDIGITPYLADHSASEAFCFLVKSRGKKIFYTGDFRDHGHKKAAFEYLMNQNFGHIDALITEGTMLGRPDEKRKTEKEVLDEISAAAKNTKGPIFVLCSGQNIDLMTTLGAIADRTGRYLAVDGYIALLLERLIELAKKDGFEVKIPGCHKKYFKILMQLDTTKKVLSFRDRYPGAIGKIRSCGEKSGIDWKWVRENETNLIIPVRTGFERWIGKICSHINEALFVYSMWEGYLEDPWFSKTVDFFRKRNARIIESHTTGHAYADTIKRLVVKLNPDKIIPIHTEHPEVFRGMFGDKVIEPENGRPIEV